MKLPQTLLVAFLAVVILPLHAAHAGTIAGAVELKEPAEQVRPARYYRGPFRGATGAGRTELSPFENVVLYVEGDFQSLSSTESSAVVRQHRDRFVPHVLPVSAGTTVTFPNDDNYYHNVFSIVAGDRFDLGRYGKGEGAEQLFEQPAVVVRCEIHAGMKAYVIVLDTPLFTVPGDDGRYELEVPAGAHKLKAWHPGGERVYDVDVPESGSVTVDISL